MDGECHIREYFKNYTFEIHVQTINGVSVGMCAVDFSRDHPCNWENDGDIMMLANASDDVLDHLISSDIGCVLPQFSLMRFFGYDTRFGGHLAKNWCNLTHRDRVLLLLNRLINLTKIFD